MRAIAPKLAELLRLVAADRGCAPGDLAGTPIAIALADFVLRHYDPWGDDRPTPVVSVEPVTVRAMR